MTSSTCLPSLCSSHLISVLHDPIPFARQGNKWFVRRPGAVIVLTINSSLWTVTCSVGKGTQCPCLKVLVKYTNTDAVLLMF